MKTILVTLFIFCINICFAQKANIDRIISSKDQLVNIEPLRNDSGINSSTDSAFINTYINQLNGYPKHGKIHRFVYKIFNPQNENLNYLIYKPDSGFVGVDTFYYDLTRAKLFIDTAIVIIDIKNTSNSNKCDEIGFETGNWFKWKLTSGVNPLAFIEAQNGGYGKFINVSKEDTFGYCPSQHAVMTDSTILDPYGLFPVVAPGSGNYSFKLGNDQLGAHAEQMHMEFEIDNLSNTHLRFSYSAVVHQPLHNPQDEPHVYFLISSFNGDTIFYKYYGASDTTYLTRSNNGYPNSPVYFLPWKQTNIDLTNYIGQNILLDFKTYDCSQGGHFGYAYIDVQCTGITTNTQNINTLKTEIYPSITSGMVTLKNVSSNLNLDVYDYSGRCVKIILSKGQSEQSIDLSELPSGLYLIKQQNQSIGKIVLTK